MYWPPIITRREHDSAINRMSLIAHLSLPYTQVFTEASPITAAKILAVNQANGILGHPRFHVLST